MLKKTKQTFRLKHLDLKTLALSIMSGFIWDGGSIVVGRKFDLFRIVKNLYFKGCALQ